MSLALRLHRASLARVAVTIRTAQVGQLESLEALQRRASLANPGDRDAILAHPESIAIPLSQLAAGQVFLADDDGAILGFSAVLDRDDGQTELDGLFVEPSLWRAGVGRLLVERAKDYARDHSASWLHVVGNPHAEGFYVACGFVTYGSYETEFGPGLLMRVAVSGH
jgi:GNAT superfamily N-acetyltransferase